MRLKLITLLLVLLPWLLFFWLCRDAFPAERECVWIDRDLYGVCALDVDEDGAFEETERLYVSGSGTAFTTEYDTDTVLQALVLDKGGGYVSTSDPERRYPFPALAGWLCRPPDLTACLEASNPTQP